MRMVQVMSAGQKSADPVAYRILTEDHDGNVSLAFVDFAVTLKRPDAQKRKT